MKLIIINGSSCSGKSSIIKVLMKKHNKLFHLYYDSLKWLFSKYNREEHYKDVQRIALSVAKEIFSMKYDVISDSGITKEFREQLINMARENHYKIIKINLEADFDILLKRFNERVESALKVPENDRKISNLSVDRFKELYNIYNQEKDNEATIFRSDLESPEKIAEEISKML